ncbi:MAG: hypothetical protein N3G77_02300 [Nitrososphaeria archaeon]|nr:hypothetical protein [Nitrososphaeria archaeon]
MKKGYLVINTILVFIVVFGVSSTIINSLNSLPTIIEAYGVYWDGDIVLCPPNEIREEVEWAVKRWNDAILYFSLRYFMIDI